jgi:hypothetical protein
VDNRHWCRETPHISHRFIEDVREKEIACVLPNNITSTTTQVGDMHLEILAEGKKVDLIVKDAYYREKFEVNL